MIRTKSSKQPSANENIWELWYCFEKIYIIYMYIYIYVCMCVYRTSKFSEVCLDWLISVSFGSTLKKKKMLKISLVFINLFTYISLYFEQIFRISFLFLMIRRLFYYGELTKTFVHLSFFFEHIFCRSGKICIITFR